MVFFHSIKETKNTHCQSYNRQETQENYVILIEYDTWGPSNLFIILSIKNIDNIIDQIIVYHVFTNHINMNDMF